MVETGEQKGDNEKIQKDEETGQKKKTEVTEVVQAEEHKNQDILKENSNNQNNETQVEREIIIDESAPKKEENPFTKTESLRETEGNIGV